MRKYEEELVALYKKYQLDPPLVEMTDIIALTKIRAVFPVFQLESEDTAEMVKILIRQCNGGYKIPLEHMLTRNNKRTTVHSRRKHGEEIQKLIKETWQVSKGIPVDTVERILPIMCEDSFNDTLRALYAMVSATNSLHIVKEAPHPPN